MIEGPPSFWEKPKATWLPARQASCKVLGSFCRLCVEARSHLPCRAPSRVPGASFLTAVTCLPLKQSSGRVCMGCLTENRKKKKWMCWEITFSNVSVIQPFPPSGLFPHLVLENATRRVKDLASQQILKLLLSWQNRENLFSEAGTSSLVYRSLICGWMCCRAFPKLHPCFT